MPTPWHSALVFLTVVFLHAVDKLFTNFTLGVWDMSISPSFTA